MDMFESERNDIEFSVTAMDPVMIYPAEETPKEVLYLSHIDTFPFLRITCQTMHVYGGCGLNSANPVDVIRDGMSRALVYYYPLAGRLRKIEDGNLEVNCNGEGGVFVEANANCSLKEAGYMAEITPSLTKLLYQYPETYDHHDVPPLVVQVTRFLCGGFVVAFGISHCMMDGIGFSQFLKALSELVRGKPAPSVIPIWKRSLLTPRNPPQVEFHHLELSPVSCTMLNDSQNLKQGSFLITSHALAKLKQKVLAERKEEAQYCSTFEALAAFIWKARVKALQFPPNQQVQFQFAVNARKFFNPPLPQAYYGNAIFCQCITISAKELSEFSLWDLVTIIKEKKTSLTDAYLRSAIDLLDIYRKEVEQYGPPPLNVLYLSDWTKMEYSKVDFGWGEALNVSLQASPLVHFCVMLPPPATNEKMKGGVRLLTCLPAQAMQRFISEMQELLV